MTDFYLPKAKNTCDFVVLGSKPGFAATLLAAAVFAFFAAAAIIKFIKNRNKGVL